MPERRLEPYAAALYEAVDAAVAPWVEREVRRVAATAGIDPADERLAREARDAARATRAQVGEELWELLVTDVDAQRANPLAVLRRAVVHPTAALRALGVPAVDRQAFDERAFPDDAYALAPATWNDVDPSLHEPGLMWGAWKASTVLARRRAEGLR
jgi:hypothetical protein